MIRVLRLFEAVHAEDAGGVVAAVAAAVRQLAQLEQFPALRRGTVELRQFLELLGGVAVAQELLQGPDQELQDLVLVNVGLGGLVVHVRARAQHLGHFSSPPFAKVMAREVLLDKIACQRASARIYYWH